MSRRNSNALNFYSDLKMTYSSLVCNMQLGHGTVQFQLDTMNHLLLHSKFSYVKCHEYFCMSVCIHISLHKWLVKT